MLTKEDFDLLRCVRIYQPALRETLLSLHCMNEDTDFLAQAGYLHADYGMSCEDSRFVLLETRFSLTEKGKAALAKEAHRAAGC